MYKLLLVPLLLLSSNICEAQVQLPRGAATVESPNDVVGHDISIQAPTAGMPNQPVVLRAKGATEAATWTVWPKTGQTLEIQERGGGYALMFWSASPGSYHFVLSSIEAGHLHVAEHVLTLGGTPGPQPNPGPNPPGPNPPPPPPDNLSPLAKSVYEEAVKVNDAVSAGRYADNYDSILSAIAAGAYTNMTFEKAKTQIRDDVLAANREVAGGAKWQSFGNNVKGLMERLERENKLASLQSISAAFRDIRNGLAAAAGKPVIAGKRRSK